jgi:nitroimidazol reductase NimA-like FMN-containing flavoprotein (pyridoxamine 5'-phosphate oxidase superfamily)
MSPKESWFPGHLHALSEDECFELLASKSVGRVGFTDGRGPVVLPVTYVVHDGVVLFRTAPGNSLARHLGSGPAAFESDEADDYTQSGWSVLVRGPVTFVPGTSPDDEGPVPWPDNTRTLLVRITPETITGRRLLPG